MTGVSALAVSGAATGAGVAVMLAAAPLRRLHDPAPAIASIRRYSTPLAVAGAAGVLTWTLTGWVTLTVSAIAGAVLLQRARALRGAAAGRDRTERLAALATWTESVRDLVAAGVALPEALRATVGTAPPVLTPALSALAEAMAMQAPVETVLRAFAEDIDDPAGDLVVAALLLNASAAGRGLREVLAGLAAALRAEVTVRDRVEAGRRAIRRGTRIVTTVTVAMILGLRLLNPAYVAPYATGTGQLVLAIILALFAAGLGWMARLARYDTPARFLSGIPAGAWS